MEIKKRGLIDETTHLSRSKKIQNPALLQRLRIKNCGGKRQSLLLQEVSGLLILFF